MAQYPKLPDLMVSFNPAVGFAKEIVPYLSEVWLDDYFSTNTNPAGANVVETADSGFAYLFDLGPQRLIAAWGISAGRSSQPRDKARMRGHPLSAGPRYHRGHAIAHLMGGPCDINLVPQRGSINAGAFKKLEGEAANNPGSLYFTYWIYGDQSQKPKEVEQGLLIAGKAPQISRFPN